MTKMRMSTVLAASIIATGLAACAINPNPIDGASAHPPPLDPIVNTWVAPPVDQTRLPIGNLHISVTTPAVGDLFACTAGGPGGGGGGGAWIDPVTGTWDVTKKPVVPGDIEWSNARYAETIEANKRRIRSNGLPVETLTGIFPGGGNPGTIREFDFDFALSVLPQLAQPTCVPRGPIGIMKNGVLLFDPLDLPGRDALVYELQDRCSGHPQGAGVYHYHGASECLIDAAQGPSTVIGFAFDGIPIVVERDAANELPTNADLDECHGRVSPIMLDGEIANVYHYSATHEFPYVIGCSRGYSMDRSVSVSWSAAQAARIDQMAPALATTPGGVQKTSVYIISFLLGLAPSGPAAVTLPAPGTAVTYTDTWTPDEFSVLDTVKNRFVLSDSDATRFSTLIVDYLLALGGS